MTGLHSSCRLETGFRSRKDRGGWRTQPVSGGASERKKRARALLSEPGVEWSIHRGGRQGGGGAGNSAGEEAKKVLGGRGIQGVV